MPQSVLEPGAQAQRQMALDDHPGLPMPRRIMAIIAISFGTALLVFDGQVANVALPTIARELNVTEAAVTNVVTIYQLVLVMMLFPFASLGDKIGHRTFYQIGQVLFMVASAACWFVEDFALLLVMRALQAVGAGIALSVSAAMLRQIYPAKKLGTGMGINSVIVASSGAMAPTLGGYIVGNLDWQLVFVIAAPLAVISLLLGRSLPDPEPKAGRVQWRSGLLSALTMLLLVGGMQIGTHGHPLLGTAVALLGIVSAVILVRRERRRDAPVLPVDLLAKPVLGLSALAAMTCFIAASSMMISLPFRLEGGMGYDPQTVGLLLLPFPLTLLVVAPLAGWASDRIAATKLGVTGMVIAIIGMLLLATVPNEPDSFAIAWRLALAALGFGLFFAPNSRLIIGRAPRDRAAAAGGLLSTSRLVGQTLAAVLVGMLLSAGFATSPVPLYVACVLAVVAALASLARFTRRDSSANA